MNYIEIGKIPPNSKNELSTPEQLVENLKSLIGEKFPLTAQTVFSGSLSVFHLQVRKELLPTAAYL